MFADAALQRWVTAVRAHKPERPPLDIARLRAPRKRTPGPELARVEDLALPLAPPLRARLYRDSAEPLPLVLYVHGGGFVSGSLESHDRTCRRLAKLARAAVLALDIRLAPEHPAPAAIDDVTSAFAWAATDGNAEALGPLVSIAPALAGDSSGGLTAVMAAIALTERGTPPGALFLACPNADLTLSLPSVQQKGTGFGLEAAALRWFVSQWVPAEGDRERFSPLHTRLPPLPPTLLVTAEHDPLRDEGAALSERLRLSGTTVHHVPGPGLVHGFLSLDDVSPAAARAGDDLMRRFGELLRL